MVNPFQGSQTDLIQMEEVQQLRQRVEELSQELQVKEERAVLEALVFKEGREKQAKLIEKLQNKVWSAQKSTTHFTSSTYNSQHYNHTG